MSGETIMLRYRFTPALVRAASTAWVWDGRRRARPFVLVVVNFAIGFLITSAFVFAAMLVFGKYLEPDYLIAAGFGAAITVFFWIWANRRQLNRMVDQQMRLEDACAEHVVELSETGVHFSSEVGESRLSWKAFSAVFAVPEGTILRFGAHSVLIPDTALPEGLTPADLRNRLTSWMGRDD